MLPSVLNSDKRESAYGTHRRPVAARRETHFHCNRIRALSRRNCVASYAPIAMAGFDGEDLHASPNQEPLDKEVDAWFLRVHCTLPSQRTCSRGILRRLGIAEQIDRMHP